MKENNIIYYLIALLAIIAYVVLILKIKKKYETDDEFFEQIHPEEARIMFIMFYTIFYIVIWLIGKTLKKSFNRKKVQSIVNKLISSNKKPKSIVDEIYNKKQKQFDYALLSLGWGMLFYCIINKAFHTDIKIEIIIFLGGLIGLIIILRILVSYRIEKGYYGMNYEECKELIHYLMENKDKDDIDKGKKIFNEIEECNGVGQEVIAGVGELQY